IFSMDRQRAATGWQRRALIAGGVLASACVILALLVPAIADNEGPDLHWSIVAIAVVLIGAMMTFRTLAGLLVLVVLALGFAAETTGGTSKIWLGPPYRVFALDAANDTTPPNIDRTHQELARAIEGHPTLLIRDDDLLNANGLIYTATKEDLPQ